MVSVNDFEQFVKATGYITDAEKLGWSFVQQDIYRFKLIEKANWLRPDGENSPKSKSLPVTQVSYNDAMAYCGWANCRLPNYEEYWETVQNDLRPVHSNGKTELVHVDSVNTVGNVWELTTAETSDSVRLAGGSLYCSPQTCHGTTSKRKLYIDKQTANTHIGFAVIYKYVSP